MNNLKESFHEFALKEIPKDISDKLDNLLATGDQSGAALLSSQFIYNYQQNKINFLFDEVEFLKIRFNEMRREAGMDELYDLS